MKKSEYFFIKKAKGLCGILLSLVLLTGTVKAQIAAPTTNKPNFTNAPSGSFTSALNHHPTLSGTPQGLHYTLAATIKKKVQDTAISVLDKFETITAYNAAGATVMDIARYNVITDNSYGHTVKFHDTRYTQKRISYLPYSFRPNNPSDIYQSDAVAKQKQFYQDRYALEGHTAYSYVEDSITPTVRSTKSYAAGWHNAGQRIGVTTTESVNVEVDEVRKWSIDNNGNPVSYGHYAPKSLAKTTIIDEESNISVVYRHRATGRVVLEQRMISTNSAIGQTNWARTYHVYDDFGRLRAVMQPKASELVPTTGVYTVPVSVQDELCFKYIYDQKSRLFKERKPGEAHYTTYVYDINNRQVLTQTPADVSSNRWRASFFDHYGRPVGTVIFTTLQTASALQTHLNNTGSTNSDDLSWYYYNISGIGTLPQDSSTLMAASITDITKYSENYYDSYDFLSPAADFRSEMQTSTQALNSATASYNNDTVQVSFTNGVLTGSTIRVLHDDVSSEEVGKWVHSIQVYNRNYQAILAGSRTLSGTGAQLVKDYSATVYDFLGKPLQTNHYIYNDKDNSIHDKGQFESIITEYDYRTGQVLGIKRKLNSGNYKYLAKYFYDELGRLRREILGNNSEFRDYTYNIKGQLQGINEDYALTGNKLAGPMTFGQALRYDYGFDSVRKDGKISGMYWRGSNRRIMHAYGYSYDGRGFLTAADYHKQQPGESWNRTNLNFTVERVNYDPNGNITELIQWGQEGQSSAPFIMDSLQYNYEPNSNKLLNVVDYSSMSTNIRIGDFLDSNKHAISGLDDYEYDAAGNLKIDRNKKVTSVDYNLFNKPTLISFADGSYTKNIYSAAGTKLYEYTRQPSSIDSLGFELTKRSYLSNAIYINDTIQHISHVVGRSLYSKSIANEAKEEFFVKDHLGNIRSVIDYEARKVATDYLATYEVASSMWENILFNRVDEVKEIRPDWQPGDEYGALLDASQGQSVGTSILLQVMAGDEFGVSTQAYSELDSNQSAAVLTDESLLNNLFNLLSGGVNQQSGEGSYHELLNNMMDNPALNNALSGFMSSTYDTNAPKVFLNYFMLDESMTLVPEASGVLQLQQQSGVWQTLATTTNMEVLQNGYLLVFISSQMTGPVYFDNLNITLTKGNLLEENHYYPFGLPITALSNKFVSSVANRHKYQGNEYLEANELRWMDFRARQYDAQLGRFWGIDPLAYSGGQQVYSPYAAMGNAPGEMIDPNGESFSTVLQQISAGNDAPAVMQYEGGSNLLSGGPISEKLARMLGSIGASSGSSYVYDLANDDTKTTQFNSSSASPTQEQNEQGGGTNIQELPEITVTANKGRTWFGRALRNVGNAVLDVVQTGLDVVGLIPGAGEIADLANASIYALRGDYSNASVSLLAAIPVVGWTATAGKYGVRAYRAYEAVEGGYRSFSAFKRAMGSAGAGRHWHHIVEQGGGNVGRFGAGNIHNVNNVISIPGGKGSLHSQVTGYYNSIMPGTNMRVRDYVQTLDYNGQYQFGIDVLKRFGWTP